tara:strand:+ start:129 stop:494 length:366 start_codon:yes stop_codon:yes gene_type:complete
MAKINREQLRQIINETMGDHIKVRNIAREVIPPGEELPEPLVQGTFEIRPMPLGSVSGDIIPENQGVILTLSGPDGISTTFLDREDLNRGTFVIDISDIVAVDMGIPAGGIPVGQPLPLPK